MATIRIKLSELRNIIREEKAKIDARMPSTATYQDGKQRKKLPKIKNETEKEDEDLDELEESLKKVANKFIEDMFN